MVERKPHSSEGFRLFSRMDTMRPFAGSSDAERPCDHTGPNLKSARRSAVLGEDENNREADDAQRNQRSK
jgi:hypothetical protein